MKHYHIFRDSAGPLSFVVFVSLSETAPAVSTWDYIGTSDSPFNVYLAPEMTDYAARIRIVDAVKA